MNSQDIRSRIQSKREELEFSLTKDGLPSFLSAIIPSVMVVLAYLKETAPDSANRFLSFLRDYGSITNIFIVWGVLTVMNYFGRRYRILKTLNKLNGELVESMERECENLRHQNMLLKHIAQSQQQNVSYHFHGPTDTTSGSN